jgi:U2 small nuclear ribonucleoprotein B''
MAEISAAPVPADSTISAPQTAEATPTPATSTPQPPTQPEHKSETLYIQNLNEKIKIDGPNIMFHSPIILLKTLL